MTRAATTSKGHQAAAELPRIAVVIPAYRASQHITAVIAGIPSFVQAIVIVDDACPERSGDVAAATNDPRLSIVRHEHNRGVGGAMVSGYGRAFGDGADVAVKMDADDQMDPQHLAALLEPVLAGKADYSKANRFLHLVELNQMPLRRRIGNVGLSFFSKLASGYWHVFDPTNGFTALHRIAFERLQKPMLARGYYFESSMLVELGIANAVVRDVALPARYGLESSNLSIARTLLAFPFSLTRSFLRRVWIQHFVRDFGLCATFGMLAFVLLTFGVSFGIYNWIYFTRVEPGGAPLGTIMLSVLSIILGVQAALQALTMDVSSGPTTALQEIDHRLQAMAMRLERHEPDVIISRPDAVARSNGHRAETGNASGRPATGAAVRENKH